MKMILIKSFKILFNLTLVFAVLFYSADISVEQIKAASSGFSGGDGTSANPYIINSVTDLLSVSSNPSAYYILGCDIDLSGTTWTPLFNSARPFCGSFDGNHHIIQNLTIVTTTVNAGLFNYIGTDGVVKNLGIDSGYIKSTKGNTGSIAATNCGTVEECYNKASVHVSSSAHYIGGIAAYNYGSFKNCYNMGAVNCLSSDYAGGIAGNNMGCLTDCYSAGSISQSSNSGGIISKGSLGTECYFLGQSGLYGKAGDLTSSTGESADKLKLESTYTGWNFSNIWAISTSINNGYPYLISKSSNCDLSDITLSNGALSPAFSADNTSYSANVDNGVSQITVSPIAVDLNTTITVNGSDPKTPVSLNVGSNIININVTAQGGTKKQYVITVTRAASSNCDLSGILSDITLSSGTLSPAFNAQNTAYSAEVANNVSQITVSPIAVDFGTAVTVNGVDPITPVALRVGSNIINIDVTAQGGTKKQYVITVTRAASSNCDLSGILSDITLSSGTLSPTFNAQNTAYSAEVANNVSQITVSPIAVDLNTTVTVNGSDPKMPVSLNVGSNIININVTAQDGTKKQYVITVTRIASSNCDLSDITLSSGTLSPAFNAQNTAYSAEVANNVSQITVSPIAVDFGTAVTVNGVDPITPVALRVGSNIINVDVTAQDGTKKQYVITVTRAASSNCDLSGITLSSGTLSPAFNADNTSYIVNVANNVSQITVSPIAVDLNTTVTVNGSDPKMPVSLNVGSNIININVTAQDGTKKQYVITVTRMASSNCDLSGILSDITLSNGTLSPAFNAQNTAYSAEVANNVSQITVSPIAVDFGTAVTVNGVDPITPVALRVGSNMININVTAQDGTKKQYVITVTRMASSNCDLSGITLSSGTLLPAFNAQNTTYSAEISTSVSQIIITPKPADKSATVTISGNESTIPVLLNYGSNTIKINVTAQDGTAKTYFIEVFRDYPTGITVTETDSSGNYSAEIPSYISELPDNSYFNYILGNTDIYFSASELKTKKLQGTQDIEQGAPSQQEISKIAAYVPDGEAVGGAYSVAFPDGNNILSSDAYITMNLPSYTFALTTYGSAEIDLYDPVTHSFSKISADFNKERSFVSFKTEKLGIFVILIKKSADIPYDYSVEAGSSYISTEQGKCFSLKINRESDSPVLYGGKLMIVTTLNTGKQEYAYYPAEDGVLMNINVNKNAVKSAVYLISGEFNGASIPKIIADVQFVK